MLTRSTLAAALFAGLMSTGAQAAAPVINGQFGTGSTAGTVAAESYSFFGGAENWSFWTFKADFMSDVSITVTPTDAMLDVIFGVWYGVESDTGNYVDLTISSMNTVFVAGADGTPSNPFAGPGEPASVSFLNEYGNGLFVLAVADYSDNLGSGPLGYTIAASVPEPDTYALLLAGLGLIGAAVRRT